jgi:signal transduction histidine kinase
MLAWALLSTGFALAQAAPATSYVTLREARLSVSDVQQTVTLPFRVDQSRLPALRADNTPFILDMDLPARSEDATPLAFYIPRVGNQARFVLMHGQVEIELDALGKIGDPRLDAAKAPRWIDVNPTLLRSLPGPVTLRVYLSAQHGRYGGLSTVYWGRSDALTPLYNQNYRWRQTVSLAIVVGLGIMGLMAAAMWWPHREATYGLFAATALLGMIRMGDRLIPEPPLPWPLWGIVIAGAYVGHLLFMLRFSLQATGPWRRWQQWAFWSIWLGGTACAALSFTLQKPWIWSLGLGMLLLPGLYVVTQLIRALRREPNKELWIITLSGLLIIVVGVRDFVAVRLALSADLTFSLIPMALFGFVLAMGWIVVGRYSRQTHAYRELNQTLEQRVAERDAQLRTSYTQIQAAEARQARMDERARIMRDIHDGVGAHLVGLVSMIKSGKTAHPELSEHAQAALDELRMAVDALQPVEGSLATVLATLRYRLGPRLQDAGIRLNWQVDEIPQLDLLTPKAVLEIQRILFEAFTNITRHARASQVDVSARSEMGTDDHCRIIIRIRDDGRGFGSAVLNELAHLQRPDPSDSDSTRQALESPLRGHGLASMLWRTREIDADIELSDAPEGGAQVVLTWEVSGTRPTPV